MTFEEQLNQIIENERKALRLNQQLENALYGGEYQGSGITQNPLYYLNSGMNAWQNVEFPDGFDFVAEFKNIPSRGMNGMLMGTSGVKTITIICDAEGTVDLNQLVRASSVEVLDLSKFKPVPSSANYLAYGSLNLVTIKGKLDFSNCTALTYLFTNGTQIKDFEVVEGSIKVTFDISNCKLFTAESLNSVLLGLSPDVTGQTLTLTKYETVKAIYDAVYGEGAWDVLAASKNNWTIAYN